VLGKRETICSCTGSCTGSRLLSTWNSNTGLWSSISQ